MLTGIKRACKDLDNDDDEIDEIDDNDDDDYDEELRAYYDGEWGDDFVPYVSGGLPASFFDSEEEPLMIGGKSIFVMHDGGGAPDFFLDVEDEPLLIGGESIFA